MNAVSPPSKVAIDLVSVGALVLRLDPKIVPWRKAASCDIHVSGGEFNVAANLADCFRLRTAVASAMVDYPIGDLVNQRVRAMGVIPYYVRYDHDGVTGPNLATVYSDRGHGMRPPVVFYNRSDEAAARLRPGDFDWESIFSGGVRAVHSGGIFASLSETTGPVIIEAMQAARQKGALCSFDLNFRAKLWKRWGDPERVRRALDQLVACADVLLANEEELQQGLGIAGPATMPSPRLDPQAFVSMIARVTERFPNLRVVATTLREVRSANRHAWSAVAWMDGRIYNCPTEELDVYDRVGGGDGFASGLLYGLLTGASPERALKLGWAHGALLTTTPGDTTMVTREQVEALADGVSARIQR